MAGYANLEVPFPPPAFVTMIIADKARGMKRQGGNLSTHLCFFRVVALESLLPGGSCNFISIQSPLRAALNSGSGNKKNHSRVGMG